MPSNDNDPANPNSAAPPQDAHGRAALLLVESLIHGMREQAMLTVNEAVDIVERAVEIEQEAAEDNDGASEARRRSHTLLSTIASSLKADVGFSPKPA